MVTWYWLWFVVSAKFTRGQWSACDANLCGPSDASSNQSVRNGSASRWVVSHSPHYCGKFCRSESMFGRFHDILNVYVYGENAKLHSLLIYFIEFHPNLYFYSPESGQRSISLSNKLESLNVKFTNYVLQVRSLW